MNVNAIRYGRIKRQAPDKIVVTKQQISDVMERMNKRATEPVVQQPTVFDMAQKVWNSRHL